MVSLFDCEQMPGVFRGLGQFRAVGEAFQSLQAQQGGVPPLCHVIIGISEIEPDEGIVRRVRQGVFQHLTGFTVLMVAEERLRARDHRRLCRRFGP